STFHNRRPHRSCRPCSTRARPSAPARLNRRSARLGRSQAGKFGLPLRATCGRVRAVTHPGDPILTARALGLARTELTRTGAPQGLRWGLLGVDVERQGAILLENEAAKAAWPVSTARAGIGGAEGSYRTPPGWHRVHRRIGEGAQAGTVFAAREPTGELWG